MKKLFKILSISALTCFSFYYTEKIVEFSKSKDPIMVTLIEEAKKYETSALDAFVFEDCIIPGMSGVAVDLDESYNKMKKLGEYNSNLLVFVNELPNISIISNKDKFIVQGNKMKKEVYLTFLFEDDKYLEEVVEIINLNNSKANIFLDGYFLENNEDVLKVMLDNENIYVGNSGYKNEYNNQTIRYSNGLIKRSFNESIFCYNKNLNKEDLTLCSKNDMYTISPIEISINYPYKDIKEKLHSGAIFTFNQSKALKDELDAIIKFINQKGYEISLISNLIFE